MAIEDNESEEVDLVSSLSGSQTKKPAGSKEDDRIVDKIKFVQKNTDLMPFCDQTPVKRSKVGYGSYSM